MVLRTVKQGEGCRFVIRPNRSLSWTQTKIVYASLASVCLIVATGFTVMGLWLVLPFAGAEVIALAIGFYLCSLSGKAIEVVSINGNRVSVEKGSTMTHRVCEFERAWASIALLPARIDWYPSRLVIRSHGKQVQLGAFLTERERRMLARELTQAISTTIDTGEATDGALRV
ncbi:MAG: DUF2244 domain-containing protein [Gammaproteobacteria bacterium]|nr:DUF2244 domain-containing protein [Gammaproteobacteria bacterium]